MNVACLSPNSRWFTKTKNDHFLLSCPCYHQSTLLRFYKSLMDSDEIFLYLDKWMYPRVVLIFLQNMVSSLPPLLNPKGGNMYNETVPKLLLSQEEPSPPADIPPMFFPQGSTNGKLSARASLIATLTWLTFQRGALSSFVLPVPTRLDKVPTVAPQERC